MTANYEALMALQFPEVRQHYKAKDVMLYALSLGIGADPLDAEQLPFVFENNLRVLPTLNVVLAHPGFWPRDMDTGLDFTRIVHGSQSVVVHKPLPTSAQVVARNRVVDILDKGPGKGALLDFERKIYDADTGELYSTMVQTFFCRGDGGIGGPARAPTPPPAVPPRAADFAVPFRTLPQTALLYRLNGDMNPLHADPDIARKAGYDRPILQGLATYGIAAYALTQKACAGDPARLRSLSARFTAPVFPGETLCTEIWRDGDQANFRVRVVERDVVALDNGLAMIIS